MKMIKQLFALSAVAIAVVASPVASASVIFQGVTFAFTQTDSNTLKFEMSGTLGGNWATATALGAFDLKDLGLDFSASGGATATIFSGPGAAGLVGINDQMNNSADCTAAGSPNGSICFDINPDVAVTAPFDFVYIIDFNKDLAIGSSGPHLQIAFTNSDPCPGNKDSCAIGSLYSQNVPLERDSCCQNDVPEPQPLALLGLGLFALVAIRRKFNT